MYAASKSNPGVRFFEYPLQAIEEQLDEMNEQNESCFLGLALIVIYNNKLYKHQSFSQSTMIKYQIFYHE
jgi:hypothetical protein